MTNREKEGERMKKNIIAKLKVQNYKDREAVVTALVNAGYVISVEEKGKAYPYGDIGYYVIVHSFRGEGLGT